LSGDTIPRDGIYSLVIDIPLGTPPGEYLFVFHAVDKVENNAQEINHTIVIISE